MTSVELAASTVTAPELPKLEDLDVSYDDGSKLSDKGKAIELFGRFQKLAKDWHAGTLKVRSATASVCELSYDLRAICLRSDGKPDWAGTTKAYAVLYEDRVTLMLGKMMLAADVKKFRDAVRRWDADNDYRRTYITRMLATTTPALKIDPETVVVGGTVELTEPLAKALREVAEGQTITKADGTTAFAKGFTDPATFAQVGDKVGQKKAAQRHATETSVKTIGAAWAQMRADVAKRTEDDSAPVYPFLTISDELHRLTSSIAVAIVGVPGEKLPSGMKDKAKVVGNLTATRDVLVGLLAVLEGGKDKKEFLAPALWTES